VGRLDHDLEADGRYQNLSILQGRSLKLSGLVRIPLCVENFVRLPKNSID
jgi:hypothetical protein